MRRMRRLLAVLAFVAAWAVPDGPAAAPDGSIRRFEFEDGTEGFESTPGLRFERAEGAGLGGGSALRLTLDPGRPEGVSRPFDFDPTDRGDAGVFVRPAPNAARDLEATLFVHDKEGIRFQHRHPLPLAPGKWTHVSADLSPGAGDWQPAGHGGQWNAYFLGRLLPDPSRSVPDERLRRRGPFVPRFGIEFYARSGGPLSLLLDRFEFLPAKPSKPATGPPIVDFRIETAAPSQGKIVELSFRLRDEPRNPFDTRACRIDAEIRSPSGRTRVFGAFFDQPFRRALVEGRERLTPDGRAAWKIRFLPAEPGRHDVRLKVRRPSGEWASEPFPISVAPGSARGYIRIASDRRSFEFEDGTPFYPIGHNVRSPTDDRCRLKIYGETENAPDPGTFAYDKTLPKMKENGEDFVEIWMSPWWLDIEWGAHWGGFQGIGRYNLENAWRLDHLLRRCEELGLSVHLVIDNHGKYCDYDIAPFMLDKEWHHSPYNADNGGFLRHAEDFFAPLPPEGPPEAARAREAHGQRIRYIASRFGASSAILGWELVSEVDLTGSRIGQGPFENARFRGWVLRWHEMTSNLLRIHDGGNFFAPNDRSGGTGRHPITTHFSGDYKRVIPAIAELPGIHYVAMDAYRDEEEPISDHLLRATQRTRAFGKPAVVTEFGGNWNAYGNYRNPRQKPRLVSDLHAGIWGAWFTDLAATPLFWWFEFIEREDLWAHFKGLRAFVAGEERGPPEIAGWNTVGLNHPPSSKPEEGPDLSIEREAEGPAVHALARKTPTRAFVWAYDREAMIRWPAAADRREIKGATVLLRGMKTGRYAVEFWDPLGGKSVDRKVLETDADGRLRIPLPAFTIDVALKVKAAT